MLKRITRVRNAELVFVKRFSYGIATIMTVIWSASTLMAVASFATYAALGHELTPEKVFPVLYLYDMMTFPLINFPYTVSTLASTATAFRRIKVLWRLCITVLLYRVNLMVCLRPAEILGATGSCGHTYGTAPCGRHPVVCHPTTCVNQQDLFRVADVRFRGRGCNLPKGPTGSS
jgi:ABC-type multidrug transport system fused ATPase/permease subunit